MEKVACSKKQKYGVSSAAVFLVLLTCNDKTLDMVVSRPLISSSVVMALSRWWIPA